MLFVKCESKDLSLNSFNDSSLIIISDDDSDDNEDANNDGVDRFTSIPLY